MELFEAVKGTTFVGIDYCAPVTMLKTGNPYKSSVVTKTTSLTAQFGTDYQNKVNKQLTKEGKEADFEAGQRSWGENLGKGIILNEKTGEISVQLISDSAPAEVVYRIDGQVVDKTVLEPFIPVKKPSGNQGTDKEIVPRAYRIDRIKALRMNGEEYVVV